jgi:hypothetical protein
MQNTSSSQGHNQPSHEDQVKGGQHSHQGGKDEAANSSTNANQTEQRNQGQTGRDMPAKGGKPTHGSGNK